MSDAKPELVAGAAIAPIIPRTIEECWRMAEAILTAGIAPDSYTKLRGISLPEKQQIARVVMGIQKGSEVGMPPLAALANIAIINNKPCVFGDGASALIQGKGHLEWMTIETLGAEPGETTETGKFENDYGCRVTMKRVGQDKPYVGSFTVGDAKRAKLWMDPHREPWIKYPKRQLKWRAFHQAANDGFADDLMGLGIREIIEDMPAPPPAKADTSFLDALPAPSEQPLGMGVSPTLETADATVQPPEEKEAVRADIGNGGNS